MFRRSLLTACLLGLTLASSCTTTSPGEPRAATTETTTPISTPDTSTNGSDEDLPFAGAPKVDNPLDTHRYEQDPCRSLTAAQAESLNLPSAGTLDDDVALGIGCDWFNEETRGEVSIAFLVDDPRGLSPEYKANDEGKWAYFEEVPEIEGYPAIFRGIADERDLGSCTVLVGVADDMVFASSLQLSQANVGKRDPCEVAVDVARLALQTMTEGA